MTISGLFIPTNIEYTSYLELRSLFTRQETEMQEKNSVWGRKNNDYEYLT